MLLFLKLTQGAVCKDKSCLGLHIACVNLTQDKSVAFVKQRSSFVQSKRSATEAMASFP